MTFDPIETFARLATRLLDDPDPEIRSVGAWFAKGARGDICEHLVIRGTRGPSPRAVADRVRRDRLLCSVAFPGLPLAEQARHMSLDLGRYQTTAWRRDRVAARCPYPEGSQKAVFWE